MVTKIFASNISNVPRGHQRNCARTSHCLMSWPGGQFDVRSHRLVVSHLLRCTADRHFVVVPNMDKRLRRSRRSSSASVLRAISVQKARPGRRRAAPGQCHPHGRPILGATGGSMHVWSRRFRAWTSATTHLRFRAVTGSEVMTASSRAWHSESIAGLPTPAANPKVRLWFRSAPALPGLALAGQEPLPAPRLAGGKIHRGRFSSIPTKLSMRTHGDCWTSWTTTS